MFQLRVQSQSSWILESFKTRIQSMKQIKKKKWETRYPHLRRGSTRKLSEVDRAGAVQNAKSSNIIKLASRLEIARKITWSSTLRTWKHMQRRLRIKSRGSKIRSQALRTRQRKRSSKIEFQLRNVVYKTAPSVRISNLNWAREMHKSLWSWKSSKKSSTLRYSRKSVTGFVKRLQRWKPTLQAPRSNHSVAEITTASGMYLTWSFETYYLVT